MRLVHPPDWLIQRHTCNRAEQNELDARNRSSPFALERKPSRHGAFGTWLCAKKGRGAFMSHTIQYIADATRILSLLNPETIERMAALFVDLRNRGGRLFILGVGGSA